MLEGRWVFIQDIRGYNWEWFNCQMFNNSSDNVIDSEFVGDQQLQLFCSVDQRLNPEGSRNEITIAFCYLFVFIYFPLPGPWISVYLLRQSRPRNDHRSRETSKIAQTINGSFFFSRKNQGILLLMTRPVWTAGFLLWCWLSSRRLDPKFERDRWWWRQGKSRKYKQKWTRQVTVGFLKIEFWTRLVLGLCCRWVLCLTMNAVQQCSTS